MIYLCMWNHPIQYISVAKQYVINYFDALINIQMPLSYERMQGTVFILYRVYTLIPSLHLRNLACSKSLEKFDYYKTKVTNIATKFGHIQFYICICFIYLKI